jgi:nucleoside 2-deoxyribosyltransferase
MVSDMKLIYIAGPYRAYLPDGKINISGVHQNIEEAGKVALKYWQAGNAVICPHKNTAYFDGAAPDEVWLEGDLEMIRRCDAVVMMKGWENSKGSIKEHELAQLLAKEIIYE